MGIEEVEQFLLGSLTFDQFPDDPQPVGTVRLGDLAGLLDGTAGVSPA